MRIVDLSWPFAEGMPAFPGDPPFTATPMGRIATHGFVSRQLSLVAHSGTHMDAPSHVLADGQGLDELPLSRFFGPAVLLDLRSRPGLAVTADDVEGHVARIRGAAFALLWTGASAKFGEPEYFSQSPYLTEEAAKLFAGLGLSGLGIDACGVDPVDARELIAHRILLSAKPAGLVIVENLRNMEALPGQGFLFLCLPVFGQDGSPTRAVALTHEPGDA